MQYSYATETKNFYALTASEYQDYLTAVADLAKPLKELAQAIEQKQEQIDQSKEQLNQKIKPLIHGEQKSDITELIDLHEHKWTYIPSNKLQSYTKKYKLPADEGQKNLLLTNDNLDDKKLKQKISDYTNVNIELFKEDAGYAGSLGAWAAAMNRKPKTVLWGRGFLFTQNYL